MKKSLIWILIAIPVIGLIGCSEDNNGFQSVTPEPPQGVYAMTGDHAVYLYFNGPYQRDISEFIVWRSLQATTGYVQIGSVPAQDNPNLDLIVYEYIDNTAVNGTTYYYAVSSVNSAGESSGLSAEEVYDTPRPEGTVILYPKNTLPALSGFNFAAASVVPDTSIAADVFVDIYQGTHYLNARDVQTDLQDMGYTSNFTDIGYAPDSGWSALGFVELIKGHTYVIWTRDSHYAKMRVLAINLNGSVSFQWAYQTAGDNRELVAPIVPLKKPVHGPGYLRTDNTAISSNR